MATQRHRFGDVREVGRVRAPKPITYPESDGKPVAETPWHARLLFRIWLALERAVAGNPLIYVGGNMLIYYEEGNPRKSVSPDVFMTKGMAKEPSLNQYLRPQLQGYRLRANGCEPMAVDGEGALLCEEFGLRVLIENGRLEIYSQATGERLLSPEEAEEVQRLRAESEHQRAENERERAENERERAEAAERRAAELERLLSARMSPSEPD